MSVARSLSGRRSVTRSVDSLLVGQQLDGPGPVSAPHTAIEAECVDDVEQQIPDVLVWDRLVRQRAGVKILTAMLGCMASANSFGRSIQASTGAGGSNGWVSPRWSITRLVLGLRAASCPTCSRRPGQAILARLSHEPGTRQLIDYADTRSNHPRNATLVPAPDSGTPMTF
jgi:hypothetical protein